MKEYTIHYGDSGEPNTGLFETKADDELEALKNFAREFSVPYHGVDITRSELLGVLQSHGFIMGDIEC